MERLTIGEILRPQGIMGELKIKCLADNVQTLKSFKKVYIDGKEYKVLSFRAAPDCAYIGISGIGDRDAADKMRGKMIEGLRSDAPDLEKGRFYIVDVIGCAVYDENDKKLGVITDILPSKNDIYVVNDGKSDIMFPLIEGIINKYDIENRKIIINSKRFNEVAVK
jgi:16S rRNA processing protein RimM